MVTYPTHYYNDIFGLEFNILIWYREVYEILNKVPKQSKKKSSAIFLISETKITISTYYKL
jgi:hypothetical protein